MAENRFKKSINNATDNTIDDIKDNIKDDTKDYTKYGKKDHTKDDTKDNIKDIIKDNSIDSIQSNANDSIIKKILEKDKKNKGSNHTIYLSAEVGEKLNRLVKKTKKSKSTLVDEILKEVLKEI